MVQIYTQNHVYFLNNINIFSLSSLYRIADTRRLLFDEILKCRSFLQYSGFLLPQQ